MNNSKQAFWVLLGSLAAFIFSIISSMILSRYFNKIDYGTYKQVLYVYNSLLVIFTLGLPKTYSFFLPRIPINEVKSAIRKINNILILSGIAMSLTLFIGADYIASALNNHNLATPLKFFSLVPVFLLPTVGLEGVLATFKKTKLLAIYHLTTKILLLTSVVIPVIMFDGGVNSAIIGFTAASFVSFAFGMFLKFNPIKINKSIPSQLNYKQIFDYSLPLFYAGFWGVIISSSDQFFISRYFGPDIFADFANGSLQLPFVTMIVAATSVVLAPIYSKLTSDMLLIDKQKIIIIWHSVLSKTIKLTYPLVLFFIFFASEIMIALYGVEYKNSGSFFQVKLIINFFTLIAYAPLILSIGGNKYYLKVHMYGALFLITLQALAIYMNCSAIVIVWISVLCEIIRIFAMLYFVAKYLNLENYKLFPWLVIGKISPCIVILYVIKNVINTWLQITNVMAILFFSFIIYIIVFLLWAHIVRLDYKSLINPLLKKVL